MIPQSFENFKKLEVKYTRKDILQVSGEKFQ